MFGSSNLGKQPFGIAGGATIESDGSIRNSGIFLIEGFPLTVRIFKNVNVQNIPNIDVEKDDITTKLRIEVRVTSNNKIYKDSIEFIDSNNEQFLSKDEEFYVGNDQGEYDSISEISIETFKTEVKIINRIKPNSGYLDITGNKPIVIVRKLIPTIEQYLNYIRTNTRTPIYKLEILRKEDESVREIIEGEIISNSGSITNTLDEGVRRTCSFTLDNHDGKFTEFINNVTIGDKFKIYLGYKINDVDKYFSQGVYIFDDPSIISNRAQKEIEITGTDKWSMLNGQNGGILEGTYVIEKGTKIGDLIRRTLRLNIVNDPIEPSIDKVLEEMEITYNITKSAGETVSDIFLEVALNVSAYIYYDENGRLQMYPVDNDMFKSSAYNFSRNEYNYLSGTKQYKLSEIYNSVLVIGENIKDTETPIVYEALNNDLSDPNSIPNVGFKKVKKITEYTKGIDTMQKAQERGNWELKKAKAKTSSVDISCLSLYHLDVNQIVTLEDSVLNDKSTRYLINSIDLPIGVDVESTIELIQAVENE